MDLIEETVDGVTMVVVAGRMDAAGARQFSAQASELVQAGRSRLLIDASRLDYIGSMGLRALLLAANLATRSEGRLVLCGQTAPIRHVIELAGFAASLESYATREDALRSFADG